MAAYLFIREGTPDMVGQERTLREAAEEDGYRPKMAWEDETGTGRSEALLRGAKRGDVDAIYVVNPGDILTDPRQLEDLIVRLTDYRVPLVIAGKFRTCDQDGLTVAGEVMVETLRWIGMGWSGIHAARVKAGLKKLKASGKVVNRGRKGMTPAELMERHVAIVKWLKAGYSVRETARKGRVSTGTVQRVKRAIEVGLGPVVDVTVQQKEWLEEMEKAHPGIDDEFPTDATDDEEAPEPEVDIFETQPVLKAKAPKAAPKPAEDDIEALASAGIGGEE